MRCVPVLVAVCLLGLSACSPSKSDSGTQENKPPVEAALKTAIERDLDRICNAEEKSGALELQPSGRAMHTGVWLAQNLESREARELSASMSPRPPEERAAILKVELAKHGIEQCEILHAWGHP